MNRIAVSLRAAAGSELAWRFVRSPAVVVATALLGLLVLGSGARRLHRSA